MTFKEFKYLNETEQEELLWKQGVELGRRKGAIYHYILYQVDGFYMEVQYIMPGRILVQIACFEDPDLLDPYLDKILINVL